MDSGILRTLDRLRPRERFVLSAGVGNNGVDVGLGYRPKTWLDVGGYAEKLWTRPGWAAGARATVHF